MVRTAHPDSAESRTAGAPSLRVRARLGTRVEEQDDGALKVSYRGQGVSLGRLSPGLSNALQRLLSEGGTPESLEAEVAPDGVYGLAEWHYCLGLMETLAALEAVLEWEGQTVGRLVSMSAAFRVCGRPPLPETPLVLSSYALARRINERLLVESPLALARVELEGLGIRILPALVAPGVPGELASRSGLPETLASGLADLFHGAGLLSPVAEGGQVKTDVSALSKGWEFHDAFFHFRSRLDRTDSPYGVKEGSIRDASAASKAGEEPTTAGESIRGEVLPLPAPGLAEPSTAATLEAAMEARRSIRMHGAKAISRDQLGAFLYRVAGDRPKEGGTKVGAPPFRRTYPSGGARYPLELYLLVGRAEGLEPGLFRYDPKAHSLEAVTAMSPVLQRTLDAYGTRGGVRDPQVLILTAAKLHRTSARYASIAYSLVLKEVGILMQSMYLVATALDLAPCAIGGGESGLIAEAKGIDPLEEVVVGEFLLGSRG